MNVKSEIAHVRFKTRMNGNMKVLTVEEMQSDFAIAALKAAKTNESGKRITDFPFRNNWYELTTKRLIRYAADNDFDAVAIPKGDLAANRYGESIDKIREVIVTPSLSSVTNEPLFRVTYFGGGNREIRRTAYRAEDISKLEKEIGSKNYLQFKDDINNFINNPPKRNPKNKNYISKFDKPIIIGSGAGKYRLYNEAIPSFMKKYGKKWNAKVYDDEIVNQKPTTKSMEENWSLFRCW